jgi:uncharacterized protein (DUF58 family)
LETTAEPLIFDSVFLSKLEQLYILSRKVFRGRQRAERRSRQLGASLEFADYRTYASGDDLRTIDWNIYGRLDRLFVKLFEEEQDLHIYFLIDASGSMQWSTNENCKFDQARRIAASLAYIALANLDRVNIYYFDAKLRENMGMARGKSQFHKALDFLRRTPNGKAQTNLLESVHTFTKLIKRRGLVFLLSDFFDPAGYQEPITLLRHAQFEVELIQLLDEAELNPQLKGDLKLLDAETTHAFDVTADNSLLNSYQQELGRFLSGMERFALKHGINYARATTAIPFEDLVLRVLRGGHIVK